MQEMKLEKWTHKNDPIGFPKNEPRVAPITTGVWFTYSDFNYHIAFIFKAQIVLFVKILYLGYYVLMFLLFLSGLVITSLGEDGPGRFFVVSLCVHILRFYVSQIFPLVPEGGRSLNVIFSLFVC